MEFDKRIIGRKAQELGFIRDTFEKTCRLAEIIRFIGNDQLLSKYLALKGGTAINLSVFKLPRLSVDIDLDFAYNLSLEETSDMRRRISGDIDKYMFANGYTRSIVKSKLYHTLDSGVYVYQNAGGRPDNIKIEINYSLRAHVLPLVWRSIEMEGYFDSASVLSVATPEMFASKIKALVTRAAARELYDINNAVRYELFGDAQTDMLRKCVVFYAAVAEKEPAAFDLSRIDSITRHKIKTDLLPVIRKDDKIDLETAQKRVKAWLADLLVLTENERAFLSTFRNKDYRPELLFEGDELERVRAHPMAAWKMQPRQNDRER
ncbi:MAG: nucleotidyl transferase AbiEii/AbiGii toxin family protein [Oscillospiraceae bacterium]|jgi:predicted nucleotidyltransferase component of viral defense system|nr:nucleotidyl transferase AbiEii/AbiGii toxin family protein [Oscillospiraceae bacterium]